MTPLETLARGYRQGGPTPLAVVELVLAGIAGDEPRLNAVASLRRAAALQEASRATADFAERRPRGPLHGVPVAVKDLFAMAGEPTSFGADPVFQEHPLADSLVVARLRAAGAVIVAKAQMLEFAYGAPSPAVGQTNNPRDPARTAGGSSGGSAALVAAGHVPVSVGTDTGGSIRIPAAYCGIVGMKPSWGLVDLGGALPLSWTLDHGGPLSRCVGDARLLLACLAERAMPRAVLPPAGLRLGVLCAYRDAPCVSHDARAGFALACEALAGAGARLVDVAIPELDLVSAALLLILLPEALAANADRLARAPERMAAATRLQFDAAAGIPAIALVRARQFRMRMRDALARALVGLDALIAPTVPFAAPAADPPIEQGGGSDEMLCTALANLVGAPAITLPAPVPPGGLPIGLQLMAGYGRDAALLDVAEAVEGVLAGVSAR